MPAYNEAECIGRTIREIRKALAGTDCGYEVIVVDDGSADETFARASAAADGNIKAVRYADNNGKGHALKYGYQYAGGDMVLFLDADSDLPPSQISNFVDRMKRGDTDVVIGSKSHPQSRVKYPTTRRFSSKVYAMLVKALFKLDVSDTQTGIKLFRREVLDRVFPKMVVKRYAFDLELLANAARLGYRVCEVPVTVNYQFASRINLRDIWRIFLDTMGIFYRSRITHYYDA